MITYHLYYLYFIYSTVWSTRTKSVRHNLTTVALLYCQKRRRRAVHEVRRRKRTSVDQVSKATILL